MIPKVFDIKSVDELSVVTDYLLGLREKSNIMAFYGQMGAGKTTLIKNICHALGVSDEVNSPTFALVNEYFTKEGASVFHFDFYRIKNLRKYMILVMKTIFMEEPCVCLNGRNLLLH